MRERGRGRGRQRDKESDRLEVVRTVCGADTANMPTVHNAQSSVLTFVITTRALVFYSHSKTQTIVVQPQCFIVV